MGIVRYPSRAAFFAMQQREDFKELHAHKDAGMDFTIVMSCLPAAGSPHAGASDTATVSLVLSVLRDPGAGPGAGPSSERSVACGPS